MSKRHPTVTVIIPTYNSSGTLKLALETVLWQDFADFEVWVVGDGCSDDSEAVVASFHDDRVCWANLPANSGGPSVPRNEALRRARGEFIAYLGHDDLWFPWHLSQLVDCIETSNCDLVASLGLALRPQGVFQSFTLPEAAWEGWLSPSNWLHRKDLVKAVGPWSPAVQANHDREFLQRVLASNARIDCRERLSVLKFPAALWPPGSPGSDPPQARYAEAMRKDAPQLALDVLTEFAAVASRSRPALRRPAGHLPQFLRRLVRRARLAGRGRR
jgi:glycosyltransferase involved in cell wall biosynthesis